MTATLYYIFILSCGILHGHALAPTAPPRDLKVKPYDQHSLIVYWKAPPMQDRNGEILRYYFAIKLANSDEEYKNDTVEIGRELEKEHGMLIKDLKTYTQYTVVMQAINKMGVGPISEEVNSYTGEGVPSMPPHDALCTTLTPRTIRVSWVSPPLASANGIIKDYKVIYGPSDRWYDETSKYTEITSSSEIILEGLNKFTNYSIEVLATTSGGDGVRSIPITCQTEHDAPRAPAEVKALVMSQDSILVSWTPPILPNGVITHYTVYTQSPGSEPTSNNVSALKMSYSATDLNGTRYDFWVTASTVIGEGNPSLTVSASPNTTVPAKIASFDDSITASYKEDVKLPCLAVGVHPSDISWKVKGAPLKPSHRLEQMPDGSLLIIRVAQDDAGDYTCRVENQFGTDSVTHKLTVNIPPFPPAVTLSSSSESALSLRLQPVDTIPTLGYTIHYKQEFGDWETVQVSRQTTTYTLESLYCGSRYQVYVTAYNSIGTGEASDVLNASTRGSKPIPTRGADIMTVSSGSVTLHLWNWQDGGCPMTHFVVENKKKGAEEWNEISNSVKPSGKFVVSDLEPATQYLFRITAHNNAGFIVSEFEYATLTVTGEDIYNVHHTTRSY